MNQYENESCREALEKRKNDSLICLLDGSRKVVSNYLKMSTPPGFTYHGEEHVNMVEQYVGRLLGEKRIAKLTDDELFILLMGVLCHDVGMVKYKEDGENYIPDRGNHNIASYLMVYDQPNNKEGTLGVIVPSKDPKYYKAIAELCLGHRDHKDKKKQIIYTLSTPCKIEGCDDVIIHNPIYLSSNNKIHVEYLAAILRLADEIDVTNQRAPWDVERHIRSFITEVAKKHWCTHELIDHVEIKPDQDKTGITTIIFVPNKDEIKARSKDPVDGLDLGMLLSLIFERLDKIKEEIKIVNEITKSPSYFDTGLSVEFNAKIKWDEIVTEEKYKDYLEKIKEEEEKKKEEKKTGADYGDSEKIATTQKKNAETTFQ